jgi:hypothetical protein
VIKDADVDAPGPHEAGIPIVVVKDADVDAPGTRESGVPIVIKDSEEASKIPIVVGKSLLIPVVQNNEDGLDAALVPVVLDVDLHDDDEDVDSQIEYQVPVVVDVRLPTATDDVPIILDSDSDSDSEADVPMVIDLDSDLNAEFPVVLGEPDSEPERDIPVVVDSILDLEHDVVPVVFIDDAEVPEGQDPGDQDPGDQVPEDDGVPDVLLDEPLSGDKRFLQDMDIPPAEDESSRKPYEIERSQKPPMNMWIIWTICMGCLGTFLVNRSLGSMMMSSSDGTMETFGPDSVADLSRQFFSRHFELKMSLVGIYVSARVLLG